MVNSPLRPNSRPPTPMECGGMTPLWNRETCLPVHRTASCTPSKIKPNQTTPHPIPAPISRISRFPLPPRSPNSDTRTRFRPQSRQKPQQSRLIVLNQGKRQMMKTPPMATPPRQPRAPLSPSLDVGRSRLDVGCFLFLGKNPCNRA